MVISKHHTCIILWKAHIVNGNFLTENLSKGEREKSGQLMAFPYPQKESLSIQWVSSVFLIQEKTEHKPQRGQTDFSRKNKSY